jgi:predicted F0F1-ATPase subunit
MKTSITQDKERNTPGKEQFTLSLNESNRLCVSRRKGKVKKTGNQDTWFYLGFVGEIGYAIALPIVGGALVGEYIDRHMSTYPRATLSLLFIGAVISILGFIRTIQVLMNRKD